MDEQRTGPTSRPAPPSAGDSERKLDQLDNTLEHLGRLCGRLEQAEQRFKQMTDECGRVLNGLVSVDHLHVSTIATLNDRLGDWCSIERKLLEESARRIERFERGVEREWTALRQLHEEPIVDLREQADKLRLACLDAARLVRERLDAADHGYLLQTANLERRLSEWSERVLQAAAARASGDGGRDAGTSIGIGAPGAVDPWPLDGVAQLHQELRVRSPAPRPRFVPTTVDGEQDEQPAAVSTDSPSDAAGNPAEVAATQLAVIDNLAPPAAVSEPAPTPTEPSPPPQSLPSSTLGHAWIPWAALGAIIGIVAFISIIYIGRMQHRLDDLESRAQEAVRQQKAAEHAAVEDARRAEAQRAAERAGRMVDILAAPDLRRFDLVGVGSGQGAYGQVLWSRSRGMAVTAVGLPTPAGKVYRVWVSEKTQAAAAGVLTSDGSTTASLILPGPLTLPRPLGIAVTLENDGAEGRPAGPTYLTRVPAT